MSFNDPAHDIAATLAVRKTTIPARYVQENCKTTTNEAHVHHTVNIFLRIDGKAPGGHVKGARGWSQIMHSTAISPHWFFFQLMVLLCETVSEGSVTPPCTSAEVEKFKAAAVDMASMRLNLAGDQRRSNFQLFKFNRHFNRLFAHEVEFQMGKLRVELAEKATSAGGRRKRGSQKKQPPKKNKENAPPPWLSDYEFNGDNISRPSVSLELILEWDREAPLTSAKGKRAKHADEEAEEASNDDDDDDDEEGSKRQKSAAAADKQNKAAESAPAFEGEEISEKISFLVTPIPRAGGDVNNPEEVVGLLVRFVVIDPQINTGRFFSKLLSNAGLRRVAGRPRFSQAFSAPASTEMFPNYSAYYGHNSHPVATSITSERFIECALLVDPSLKERVTQAGESMAVLATRARYEDLGSPFNLHNLMTIERALQDAVAAGAAPMTANHWWEFETKMTKCPADFTTYKYPPEAVFLSNNTWIGLSEQLFPHIRVENDFIAALMSGRDLGPYLKTANYLPTGGQEAAVAAAPPQKLHDVCDRYLVSLSDLARTSLVNYATGNEFIHCGAEAKRINGRLETERPAHAFTTIRIVAGLIRRYGRDRWRDYLDDHEDDTEDPTTRDPRGPAASSRLTRDAADDDADDEEDDEATRDVLPVVPLRQRVAEYERYEEICQITRSARMETFAALWEVNGDCNQLPIPEPIKAMLRWYRTEISGLPDITREFNMFDPDMGILGNSLLRQLKMFGCVNRALQPLICLLCEGLFSCYQFPATLKFNFILGGRHEVGKSWTAIDLMVETTIPGTVDQVTMATGAADTTQKHTYDTIRAKDECDPLHVSLKEAEKNPAQVNKEKTKLTNGQIGTEVFASQVGPDGQNVRWAQTVITDQHVTNVLTTNYVMEAKNPLASRYFRMIVALPRIAPREKNGRKAAGLTGESRMYLQINQFLSAACNKAGMVGGISMVPDMQQFIDLSNLVINYLTEAECIAQGEGQRALDIMMPYARQLVIKKAIHCVYDMRGGPRFKRPFEARDIRLLDPYLYSDTEILWWVWSAMGSSWIDDKTTNVLRACNLAAGIPRGDCGINGDDSPYQLYERDFENRIQWRTTENRHAANMGGKQNRGDETRVDLTYITVYGNSIEQVAQKIAAHTKPALDQTDVQGVLQQLKSRMIKVSDGFTPQPAATFAMWHRFTNRLADDVSSLQGVKRTDLNGALGMPPEYLTLNPDRSVHRTEFDVPRTSSTQSIVDIERNCIHVMPHLINTFSTNHILHALWHATLCESAKRGKYLLGFPSEQDPAEMRVWACSDDFIQKELDSCDADNGWKFDRVSRKITWVGDPNVPEDERPLSRRLHGIGFNRRGGISESDSVYLTTVPAAPSSLSLDEWQTRTRNEVMEQQEVREISKDLDADSALRQHIRAGCPIDEPVRTPALIVQTYRDACDRDGVPWTANANYPSDSMKELEKRSRVWSNSSSTRAAINRSAETMRRQTEDADRRRPPKRSRAAAAAPIGVRASLPPHQPGAAAKKLATALNKR